MQGMPEFWTTPENRVFVHHFPIPPMNTEIEFFYIYHFSMLHPILQNE